MKRISIKIKTTVLLFLITIGIFAYNLGIVEAADPNGSMTYTDSIGGLKYFINFIWALLGAFLVFIM